MKKRKNLGEKGGFDEAAVFKKRSRKKTPRGSGGPKGPWILRGRRKNELVTKGLISK